MKNKFIVLVGPPAIGKSTYTKNVLSTLEPCVVSRDEVVEEVAKDSGLTYNEFYARLSDPSLSELRNNIEKTLQERFKSAIENKKNVVVDMTHMNKKSRRRTLNHVAQKEYEKIAVVFKFDKNMIPYLQKISSIREQQYKQLGKTKQIPDQVFYEMVDRFEPVDKEEGFDTILHIDESQRIYGV
jgi:tRNA uridine 5-carbamoylmethylation protein Kti12